jgi:hypothetical protein
MVTAQRASFLRILNGVSTLKNEVALWDACAFSQGQQGLAEQN